VGLYFRAAAPLLTRPEDRRTAESKTSYLLLYVLITARLPFRRRASRRQDLLGDGARNRAAHALRIWAPAEAQRMAELAQDAARLLVDSTKQLAWKYLEFSVARYAGGP